MDDHDIESLGDGEFEEFVLSHMVASRRNPETWELLCRPPNIGRAVKTLTQAFMKVSSRLGRMKEEREEFQRHCFKPGGAGKEAWIAFTEEQEARRKPAVRFQGLVQRSLAELKAIQKELNRRAHEEYATRYEEMVKILARAIQRHQAAAAKLGISAQHDHELWQHLDDLHVQAESDRPGTASLRNMVRIYWTRVHAGVEPYADAEQVMRAAPGGASGRYTGRPEARHVDNGKNLA